MSITTVYNLLAYLVSIFSISILVLLVIRGSGSKHRKAFAVYSISTAVWLGLQCLAQFVLNQTPIPLIRLSTSMGLITSVTFFVFAKVLIRPENRNTSFVTKKWIAFFGFVLLLFGLGFTSLSVTDASASVAGLAVKEAGIVYAAEVFLAFILFIAGVIILIRNYKKVGNDLRGPLRLIIASVIFAVVINAVGAAFFSSSQQSQALITISQLVIVIALYRSIQKYKLFDLRSFVARSFGYTLMVVAIGGVVGAISLIGSRLIFRSSATTEQRTVIDIFSAVVAALMFSPLKRYFDKAANKLFYSNYYEPQVLLAELNQILVSEIDIHVIMPRTIAILQKAMGLEKLIFIYGPETYFSANGTSQAKDDDLDQLYKLSVADKGNFITRDSLPADSNDLRKLLVSLKLEAVSRIDIGKDKPTIFVWGQKLNGTTYLKKDTDFVQLISNEFSIALQNALRYEEIANFNVTLQKKVDDATAELKDTNQKLVELDEAKDEFISMASHQLRTPLTSVKGYLSMVLEGDAGKVAKSQKELLSQAFISAQRMVYLISDLLNVSRLKTGKFVIEAQPTYLPDVVEEELKQVEETAKSREVKINFKKPKEFPTLNLDDTKIRQVIMNFVDNAIYYTPAGGEVEISLESKGKTAEFRVKDNGIGVPKAEQGHLFSKFYRAGNARKARPDGTGLGLFMAKKVIDSSGGEVIFESTEGKGSTFGFQFEVQPIAPKTPPKIRKA